MPHQIVLIHGGDSFRTYADYLRFLKKWRLTANSLTARESWKTTLANKLGRQWQVLRPQMPNKMNARYLEWKIWFEKHRPFIKPNVIFIGHSLGGMFLAKYLAENTWPEKIAAVILIAAPHNRTADIGDFRLPKSLARLSKQAQHIFLFHSPNDPVVPISELRTYAKALPQATMVIIPKRGHFSQATFPELVRLLKHHQHSTGL